VQFARIAQGSLKELETYLVVAERVGILDSPRALELNETCDRLGRMLRNLIRALQAKA
jgi:four helix bundle protein